jgi:hypothetical protein
LTGAVTIYIALKHNIQHHIIYNKDFIEFWCLTPLSAIFQLYHGEQLKCSQEAGVPGENHQPWASNW